MSTYKIGDKVVLRKDLVFGKKYGRFEWGRKKDEYLGDLDYVEILNVFSESAYEVTTGWCITDEMISHKYIENSDRLLKTSKEVSTKYQAGDKVVVRNDLIVSEYYGTNGWAIEMEGMKELPYVILGEDSASGFIIDDYPGNYRITPEMISHKYEEESTNPTPEIPDHLIEQIEYTPTYPSLMNELESAARENLINAALDSGDKELFMQLTGGL